MPVTVPTFWSMLSEVAPVTVQESVLLEPDWIVAGLAVKLVMTGTVGAGLTVIVLEAVVFPALLLAFSV